MSVYIPNIILSKATNDNSYVTLRNVALILPIVLSFQIGSAYNSALLEGIGRLDLTMKCQLIGPVVIFIVLGSMFLTGINVSGVEYALALCLGALTDFYLIFTARKKVIEIGCKFEISRSRLSELAKLVKSGFMLQGSSIMSLFLDPLNKFILNHYTGASVVTNYDLAMKLIWGIQSLFGAAMRVFLQISAEGHEAVSRAFSKMISLIAVPVVIIHSVAAILLSFVVRFWLKIDIIPIMSFFAIATISNFEMIYITPIFISLIGNGRLQFIFRSQAIVAATNIVISFLLVPYFGLTGAAIGLLCASSYNMIAVYLYHDRNVGKIEGILRSIRSVGLRYIGSIFLFIGGILSSISNVSYFYISTILLICYIVVLAKEPIAINLLKKIFHPGRANFEE